MTNRGTPTPVATTLLPREAVETMLRHVWPRKPVQVPLMSALGRILAHEVASPIDLPAWDNSGMDGYALQAEDVEGKIPVELDVIEEIAAGAFPTLRVRAGTCARIFTGAPVPDGADTVIRQEDTEAQGAERVVIRSDRDVRRNVRPRGEDLRVGDIAVRAGTELMPAHLGVLASIAAPTVSVYGTPTVAVIATGDEIADLDEREAILAGR